MKIDAVAVSSSNIEKTKEFYSILGFTFEDVDESDHVEAMPIEGSARLMIDKVEFFLENMGEKPKPSNHSSFAIQFDTSKEIDDCVKKLKNNGFSVEVEPWDAFWGQHYAIVKDPDGYKIDLYSYLK